MAYIKFNSLNEDIVYINDASFYKAENNDDGKHYYTIGYNYQNRAGDDNALYYSSEAARNADYERLQEYIQKFYNFTKFSDDSPEQEDGSPEDEVPAGVPLFYNPIK